MGVRSDTYEWLKGHIATLPRDKGTFLTETEVAQAAGASRTPVREALMRLESEGLIERIPRRGAYVPPLPDSEIRAVMEARQMIEVWTVEQLLSRGADFDLAEVESLLVRQTENWSDPVTFIELDRDFHSHLVAASGNAVVNQFYSELRDRQLRMGVYAVTGAEHRATKVVEEHRRIVDAIRARDVAAARKATTEHLLNTLEAMLR